MTVSEFGDVAAYSTRFIGGAFAWIPQPNFRVLSLTIGTSPTLSEARVAIDYGNIKRRGANAFAHEPRQDWEGQFVRIQSLSAGVNWSGVVVRQQEQVGAEGLGVESGTQVLSIVGYEWYLMRSFQANSIINDVDEPGDKDAISYVMGCNDGLGQRRDMLTNDADNKRTGQLAFATQASQREAWTAETYVDYLLKHHINASVPVTPRPIVLTDASRLYLKYRPTVPGVGRTLFESITRTIPVTRGLVWWLDWLQTPAAPIYLNVTSMTDVDIDLPDGTTLPSNGFIRDVSGLGADAQLTVDPRHDRYRPSVTMRGGLQRSVFTAQVNDGQLQEGWDLSGDKYQAYLDGVKDDPNHPDYDGYERTKKADLNDGRRRGEDFAGFFSLFVFRDDWNGVPFGGGNGDVGSIYIPGVSTPLPVGFVPSMLRTSDLLPLKVGLDYTTPSEPTGTIPNETDPEFVIPLALANVARSGSPDWRPVEALAKSEWEVSASKPALKAGYILRTSAGQPGMQIESTGPPHSCARGVASTNDMEPSNLYPEIDYREMLFTVCAETLYYTEASWPLGAAPSGDAMIVYVGDRYRLDTMEPGTVWDAQDGRLKQALYDKSLEPEKGVIRDDREALQTLARLAYEWYATPRSTMRLETKLDQTADLYLGYYVRTAGYTAPSQTVNAVVSQIRYDFNNGRIGYNVNYSELDFANV